jgi:hypothetical protein
LLHAPGSGLLVQIPVEGLGEQHALRGLQAHGVNVVDEQQQRRQRLLAGDAELGRRLDRIDGVAARVRQTDDLRPGGLGLQQDEKSAALSGWRTPPAILPPASRTTAPASVSIDWPKA